MTIWCAKCGRFVGPRHMHSVAFYFQRPGGPWQCRWCRAALKNNRVECPCWAGVKIEEST